MHSRTSLVGVGGDFDFRFPIFHFPILAPRFSPDFRSNGGLNLGDEAREEGSLPLSNPRLITKSLYT